MERSNKRTQGERFNSGSFLKVLMPRISKDKKSNPTIQRPSAPNMTGNKR